MKINNSDMTKLSVMIFDKKTYKTISWWEFAKITNENWRGWTLVETKNDGNYAYDEENLSVIEIEHLNGEEDIPEK